MNKDGLIYISDEPDPEDVSRLDGYLRGRAESDAMRAVLQAEFEAKLAELEKLRR